MILLQSSIFVAEETKCPDHKLICRKCKNLLQIVFEVEWIHIIIVNNAPRCEGV